MLESEKPAFTAALRGLALALRFRADFAGDVWQDTLRVYWEDLADLPIRAVQDACLAIRRDTAKKRFFPHVGELRTVARGLVTSSGTCGGCTAGLIPATWFSAVYSANVDGWDFCPCEIGQRKRAYVNRQRQAVGISVEEA